MVGQVEVGPIVGVKLPVRRAPVIEVEQLGQLLGPLLGLLPSARAEGEDAHALAASVEPHMPALHLGTVGEGADDFHKSSRLTDGPRVGNRQLCDDVVSDLRNHQRSVREKDHPNQFVGPR